jgi:glycosyltransferase involved in cell wall biosynthesis
LQSTKKIKVILISTVTPGPNSAGQLVLNRHLVNEPSVELQVIQTEPRKLGMRKFMRQLLGRLSQVEWLHPFCQDVMVLWRGGWIDAELPAPQVSEIPSVVMTVAHEEGCYAAMRYAERHDLPLVTFFHDWWPDMAEVHAPFRSMLERSFRQLYEESSLALCVSEGMKKELGAHANSQVLLPMPAEPEVKITADVNNHGPSFKLIYAGNLKGYGAMLMKALEVLKGHPHIRLEVRGDSSSWPDSIKNEMSELGILLPFVSRDELERWLKTADAFLITQSFDEGEQRLMSTNFPSKLLEFAQYGKPLILWGPAKATGPQWARSTGQGLVVDEENPERLRQVVERLSEDTGVQERLSAAARNAAGGCFAPVRIQSDFLQWMSKIVDQCNC